MGSAIVCAAQCYRSEPIVGIVQVDRGDDEGEVVEADVDSSDYDIEIDEDEKTLSLIECESMLKLLQSDSFSNIQEQTDTGLDTKEVSDTHGHLVSESQEADLIENASHKYRMLKVGNTTIGLAM